MKIGLHLSIAGRLSDAVARAEKLAADCMQIFVNNPRGWRPASRLPEEMDSFVEGRARAGIEPLFVHSIYLINLASPDPKIHHGSVEALIRDLKLAKDLGAYAVVTHIGSHRGEGFYAGLGRVCQALTRALEAVEGPMLLLENSAGAGDTIGGRFSELRAILEKMGWNPRLGICMDTAHTWAAGYNIVTREGLDAAIAELEREVGLEHLRLIHANDSKAPLGSRLDRHQHIGEGYIGLAGFRRIINHLKLASVPFILETPVYKESPNGREEADQQNIATLRSLVAKKD